MLELTMGVNKAEAFVDDGRYVLFGQLLVMDVSPVVMRRQFHHVPPTLENINNKTLTELKTHTSYTNNFYYTNSAHAFNWPTRCLKTCKSTNQKENSKPNIMKKKHIGS